MRPLRTQSLSATLVVGLMLATAWADPPSLPDGSFDSQPTYVPSSTDIATKTQTPTTLSLAPRPEASGDASDDSNAPIEIPTFRITARRGEATGHRAGSTTNNPAPDPLRFRIAGPIRPDTLPRNDNTTGTDLSTFGWQPFDLLSSDRQGSLFLAEPNAPVADQPNAILHDVTPSASANGQRKFHEHGPSSDHGPANFDRHAFGPDPNYDCESYNAAEELSVYQGKWNQCSQRPLIELGRGVYRDGPVPESYSFLGKTNLITPGFTLFGDYRTGVAFNDNGVGDGKAVWAHRLNLDFDLRLTATERIHAFWGPLDEDGRFTRAETLTDGRDELLFFEEFDDDFDTLFFEGDLGYIWGGMTDQWAPFDLPFVVGKFPLLFQNGIWINDAIEGFAFTIPAQNSRLLDISNYEVTFFFGFDDVDSPAFGGNDNAADVYGYNTFVESRGGYWEIGHAYLRDRTGQERDYHNFTVGFTRRYFHRLSNSVRFIANAGQDPTTGPKTADGQLLLIENSLISSNPNYFVPYLNLFAGWGTPQSVARAAGTGGVLLNTGINFETDGLTGFPTLDATANDTWGGAVGINLLGPSFRWQWLVEAAIVQSFDGSLAGDEYAIGSRFQLPINFAWLLRFDAMYGARESAEDVSGVRGELRWKF